MAAVRANSRACVIELLAALKRVLSGFKSVLCYEFDAKHY